MIAAGHEGCPSSPVHIEATAHSGRAKRSSKCGALADRDGKSATAQDMNEARDQSVQIKVFIASGLTHPFFITR